MMTKFLLVDIARKLVGADGVSPGVVTVAVFDHAELPIALKARTL